MHERFVDFLQVTYDKFPMMHDNCLTTHTLIVFPPFPSLPFPCTISIQVLGKSSHVRENLKNLPP